MRLGFRDINGEGCAFTLVLKRWQAAGHAENDRGDIVPGLREPPLPRFVAVARNKNLFRVMGSVCFSVRKNDCRI